MTATTPPVPTSEELHDYTCERCGFKYKKNYDYKPLLCYRCIRYIGKKTYTIMHTIQPPISSAGDNEL